MVKATVALSIILNAETVVVLINACVKVVTVSKLERQTALLWVSYNNLNDSLYLRIIYWLS